MTTGQLPEGRYGPRARPHRRWARPVWLALALVTGLVVALLGYHNLGPKPVEGETLTFALVPGAPAGNGGEDGTGATGGANDGAPPSPGARPVDGHAVSLRFQVRRDDPARPAVCIVRARSLDGEETGRREVYVPPAGGPVELSTVIHTSRPPVTADVYGCSLQVPSYVVPGAGS